MDPGDEWGRPSDDDEVRFGPPLPPDDRLWRHPSEVSYGRRSTDRRRPPRSWPVVAASGVLGAVLTLGALFATGALDEDEPPERLVRELVRPASAPRPSAAGDDVVRIAQEASEAVPRVEVAGGRAGSGSGVVFRDNGYVLTNAHVVEGARRVSVVLADSREVRAEVVGADPLTDIAVLRLPDDRTYPTAVLGSAVDLQVGEAAIAIGSPLGLAGGSSVTTGVVSALGRRVQGRDEAPLLDMIQTDAAIAPGSSGGALLDASGAVIGITTAIAVSEGAAALGFATPIDIARSVAEDIIETGRAVHPWLGVEGADLDAATAAEADVAGGAVVERVLEGSPAATAGFTERDVIVAVEGDEVASMSGLVIALRSLDPGQSVALDYLREGRRETMRVTLDERPAD